MSAIRQFAWAKLEAFATTEVSSRILGMLRLFGALTIYTEFASPWVSHRMDDYTGMFLLDQGLFAALSVLILGYKTRIAAVAAAVCFAGLHLYYGVELGIEKVAAPVLEFQFLVLLALTPCGRSLSIDRVLAVRRAQAEGREPPPERVPWWQVELFVIAIASVHLWIAIDCSQPEWLSGATIENDLMRLWSGSDLFSYRPHVHTVAVALAWVATISAYLLAFGLLIRRWRPYLMWLGVALHFGVMLTFIATYLQSYYNLVMVATLIACFDPERLHQFISLQGDQPEPEEPQ
jgi:hypothetical protein